MRPDFTFSNEEMNTFACPWHHNITAAIASFLHGKGAQEQSCKQMGDTVLHLVQVKKNSTSIITPVIELLNRRAVSGSEAVTELRCALQPDHHVYTRNIHSRRSLGKPRNLKLFLLGGIRQLC